MKKKISIREKCCYGLGDLACNTMFTLVSTYIMFFYTDIAGIGLMAVGTIMAVSRVVDAITDPLMGIIVDKTKSKWGKARPYVLWMSVPFGIISILMFISPDIGETGKFIYALVTYILFCVVYTALNIPYSTMLSNVTDDESERLSFNMFKTIGSNGGGFVATGLTLGLVAAIGRGNQGLGFTGTVAIYAVLGVILLIVCFKNTKERIIPQAENMPVGKSIKVAIQNRPWVVACIIAFLCFTSLIMRNSGAMYYAKYYLENEAAATPLVSIATLLGIPLALVTPVIAKKVGAKRCVFIGALVQALSMAGIYFAGKNLPAIFILTAVGAVGFGIAMGLLFILGAETIDYSEWKTGIRPQGLMTAFMGFMVKIGMAVSGVLSSAILSAGGYVENVAQTEQSLNAIRMNYIWVPAGIALLIVVCILFFNLDEKKYAKVIAELHQRRENGSSKEREA